MINQNLFDIFVTNTDSTVLKYDWVQHWGQSFPQVLRTWGGRAALQNLMEGEDLKRC